MTAANVVATPTMVLTTPSSETGRKLSFSSQAGSSQAGNGNINNNTTATKNVPTSSASLELLLELLVRPDNSRRSGMTKGLPSSGLVLRNKNGRQRRQLVTRTAQTGPHDDLDEQTQNNDRYFSWYRILAERCREYDNYKATKNEQHQQHRNSWQRKLLLSSNDGGYTPLHQAVYQGDLRMILFLLQQSAIPSSSSTFNTRIPLKHVVQIMLSERKRQSKQQQQRHPSDFDSNSLQQLSHSLCQVLDDEGYTPGELLVQLQRNDLRLCREMIRTFSRKFISNDSRTRRRARSIALSDVDEQELQTQNEFEFLSRAVAQLASEHHGSSNNHDDEVGSGDDEDANTRQIQHRSRKFLSATFGCEVLTFGDAHHCVLGVGKANNHHHHTAKSTSCSTNSPSTTSKETTTSASSFRPQRVVEFSMDVRRAQNDSAIRIAAAQHHNLVVTQQGHLYTFGLGKGGRLGTGSESPCPVPVRVVGSLQHQKVIGVAAAENHSLAVTSTGHVYAWGSNRFGQLGYSSTSSSNNKSNSCTNNDSTNCTMLPRRVDGELKGIFCIQVAAGARHSVALADDGLVYVWGDNSSGQLGVVGSNPKIQLVTALLIGGTANIVKNSKGKNNSVKKKVHVTQIAASDYSTLVLGLPPTFSEMATTKSSTIPIRANMLNVIYSWGHGNHNPTKVQFPDHFQPQQQLTAESITKFCNDDDLSSAIAYRPRHSCKNMLINPVNIACARYHCVAVTDNGYVYTWGLHNDSLGTSAVVKSKPTPPLTPKSNTKGNNSALHSITEPQLVFGMLPENGGGAVVALSASEHHTAVLTDTGDLYTWGESYQPMVLGHAGVRYQPSPKRVPSVHRAVAVSVAKEHTVLLIGTTFPTSRTIVPPSVSTQHSVQYDDSKIETTTNQDDIRTASCSIPSLESLAALAVMERVDLFNILPVTIVAERTQTTILLDYCYEFIHRNLDGVLNVSQRSMLDAYLNEQLNGTTSNVCISSAFQNDTDGHQYRDDDVIHPMLVNILSAGRLRPPAMNTIATSLFSQKATHSFNDWMEGCKQLLQDPTVATVLSASRAALQAESIGKVENTKHSFRRNRSLSNVSDTSDSGLERRPRSDSFNSYRIADLARTIDTEVPTSDGLQSKHAMIVKEIRAIRKRLGQIDKLKTVQNQLNHSDIESSSTRMEQSYDSPLVLTAEQQQKLLRRPQLMSDLNCLEKAKTSVELKMQELRGRALVESARKIVQSIAEELASTSVNREGEEIIQNKLKLESKEKSLCRKVSFVEDDLTKNVTATEDEDDNVHPTHQRFYCDVCLVTCPDKNSMDLHLSGRKHRNRVAQVEEEEKQRAAESAMEAQRKRELLKVVPPTPTSVKSSSRPAHPWSGTSPSPSALHSQPKYCLPPPPHPVSDVVVVTATMPSSVTRSSTPSMKAKSLMDIMEEEARNQQKAKTVHPSSTKPKVARAAKLALNASASKTALQLPPGSNKAMKSPPWQSPSVKSVDVSSDCSSVHLVKPAPASMPSLDSFMPSAINVTRKKSVPVIQEAKSASTPWKTIPAQTVLKTEKGHATVGSPGCARRPAAVSFTEIQEQELESKKCQEDQTTYVQDGKNKWFIEKRDRAGSFNEIQSEAMKLEEERALIEEQFAIERQIMAELEAKKKALERKEKRQKKVTAASKSDQDTCTGDNQDTTPTATPDANKKKNDYKPRRKDSRGKKFTKDNSHCGKVGSV